MSFVQNVHGCVSCECCETQMQIAKVAIQVIFNNVAKKKILLDKKININININF
jgi:hypothetical protein